MNRSATFARFRQSRMKRSLWVCKHITTAGPVKEFEVHPYDQFMLDKYSPYKKWIESEGVPIIGGAFVRDVRTEKLAYWKRKDCKGAICTFSDQMVADAYIAEIDPGKSTKPQRQL